MDDIVGRLDDERRMSELLPLLAQMSANEQDVIALVLWSGLNYEEAAAALGVPVGTIKSRLSRARRSFMELAQANGHNTDEGHALARASAAQPREAER